RNDAGGAARCVPGSGVRGPAGSFASYLHTARAAPRPRDRVSLDRAPGPPAGPRGRPQLICTPVHAAPTVVCVLPGGELGGHGETEEPAAPAAHPGGGADVGGAGGDVTAAGDESRCRDAAPGTQRPPRGQRQRLQLQRGQRQAAAPLFRLLLSWGGPGRPCPPHLRAGGTTALGALLRCFPCERLCGGCAVPPVPPRPPGALPPAAPPPRRRLPPRTFRSYLPRCHRTYSCVHCRAHLARHDELISKVTPVVPRGGDHLPLGVPRVSFQGSHGRAYLFNSVVNVGCGPAEQRLLLTGLHSVSDIFCQSCKTTLGWKYEQAFESSQKYKEGKFIIEMSHMVKENGWD
ncbi:protein yippee-like 4, partial [Columba livia]|uniref:protein yippee-like 4 n=1 Tax=Columba livia TaxID=8932 RepID=UPI0031BAE53C